MIPQHSPEMSPTIVRPGVAWVLTINFGDERTVAEIGTPDGGTQPVRLSSGRDSMPSGVFVGRREMLAGEQAAVAGRAELAMYVAEPRRWIGAEKARLGDGSSVPVVQLVATVLRHVAWAAAAQQRAGAPLEVVLVRPGDWGPDQVGQLDQAARLAGLGPVRHVVEPPAGAARPAGSHRAEGARPGRRPRRRVLTLAAATGCVAVLASALVWITAGSPAEPGPGSAPTPVSAPGRPTLADPVAVPTADPSAGTAGQPGGAVPAELAATFPDLDDIARTGTSAACLSASRRAPRTSAAVPAWRSRPTP